MCNMYIEYTYGIHTYIAFSVFTKYVILLKWEAEPEFEQGNVADRVGFHHVMLVVGVWPTLLHLADDVWRSKGPVNRDVEDNLYSRFAFVFTKVNIISMIEVTKDWQVWLMLQLWNTNRTKSLEYPFKSSKNH